MKAFESYKTQKLISKFFLQTNKKIKKCKKPPQKLKMTIIIPNLLPDDEFLYSNPFNFLPFELLELIFEYLQPEDLKSLLNITGWLHDVLVASPISMRKLKLILDESWEEKIEFVQENGENVRDLSFQHCNFDDPRQVRDLMRCMTNVEVLKLSNVHISAEVFTRKFRKFFIELERVKVSFITSF